MLWLIPIAMVLLVLFVFGQKSMAERVRAGTLLRFFQYGDAFRQKSFFATLMASNSALSATVYLIIVYGYFFGIGIFPWVLGFWLATQFTSIKTIQRVEKMTASEGGFISKNGTLHEFLGKAYRSNRVRMAAAALSTVTYMGMVAAEIVLGYEVVRAIVPSAVTFLGFALEPLLFLLFIAVLIFIYTRQSGFRAVVATDRMQFALILVMMLTLLGFVALHFAPLAAGYAQHFPPLTDLTQSVFNASGEGPLAFLFFFVFMNLVFWGAWWPSAMDQWHRVAATRSARVALDRRYGTMGIASVAFLALLTFTFLSVGSMVRVLIEPELGATQPIYYLISGLAGGIGGTAAAAAIGWLGIGLVVLGMIAIFVSTVDTYLVTATQSLFSDLSLAKRFRKTLFEVDLSLSPERQKEMLAFSRKVVPLLFIPVAILFLLITRLADVFTVVYFFFSFQMTAIPILAAALLGKIGPGKKRAAFWSLVGGGLWALTFNAYLLLTINHLLLAGRAADALFYYNILYASPPLTAVVALAVYLLVPGKKENGKEA